MVHLQLVALLQLGVNLAAIVLAALATLARQRALYARRARSL